MLDPLAPETIKEWQRVALGIKEKFVVDYSLMGEELEKETNLTFADYLAEIGRQEFFMFMDAMLECSKMDRAFHGGLCDFMQRRHRQKLILLPRGHLKSTICTMGYVLWRIARNPDIRILIANYKLENAKSFLAQIKYHFDYNETFRMHYASLIPNKKQVKWNEEQLTVKRTMNVKESTIEVAGVGTELTGRHYDLIIYDDIQGPENVTTKEQLDKLRQWWNQTQFLLEPGGEQVVIGTRWHFEDLYGFILENLPTFKIMKSGIYDAAGLPVWPAKFTPERIDRIKNQMEKDPKGGKSLFVAQYLNEVIDEETAYFKRTHLKFFETLPESLGITITVDPAISEKETADFSAITVRGVAANNAWYVLECWQKRGVAPTELIDKIFEIFLRWRDKGYTVDGVAVESIAYQKSLQYLIRDDMMKRNIFMPLFELHHGKTSKEYRIKTLMPLYENGALLFQKDYSDDTGALLDEMFRYPKTVHDDLLDSLAMHMEMQTSPMRRHEAKQKTRTDRYGYPIEERSGSHGFIFA